MVRSNINPDPIWLRKTDLVEDQLYLILRVRSNVREVQVDNMQGGMDMHYEYDEVEIRYPVPDGTSTLADIATLIANESDNINAQSVQKTNWQGIHATPIDDVRTSIRSAIAAVAVKPDPTPIVIAPKV
jgi:hypothetical protein